MDQLSLLPQQPENKESLHLQINPADYSLLVAIHSNSFTHVWSQSARHVPLNEWLSNQEYACAFLEDLAWKLNSAEVVDPERDGFFVELTFVKRLGRGGAFERNNPGRIAWEKITKKKKCITRILKQRRLVLRKSNHHHKRKSG